MDSLKHHHNLLIIIVFIVCSFFIFCNQKTIIHNSRYNYKHISIFLPVDSLTFSPPISKFCYLPNNSILAIDISFERIYRLNINDKSVHRNLANNIDTIILPQKFNLLKGIIVDDFYIYLYSENIIFQYDLITNKSKVKFNNNKIKINDITITTEGEIFILDDFNHQILYIDNLGKINKFNIATKNLFMPIAFAYDIPNNELLIINKARNSIESYSKIGQLKSIIKLPNQYCTNLRVSNDKIYVWQNNDHSLYRMTKKENIWQEFYIDKPISDCIILDNLLFILSGFSGLYIYQLT